MKITSTLLKTLFILLAVATVGLAPQQTQAQTEMHVISPYEDSLWTIDTLTWAVTNRVEVTIPGSTYTGGNGIQMDPTSGTYYMIAKISGVTGRMLCTVDVVTGVLTPIGNTTENIAGIAFDSAGQLYGQSGDGGNSSETFHTIDKATAAITQQIVNMATGSDGETITYCPDNNKVYRWSGRDTNPAMECIDPATNTVTPVTRSGFNYDEVFGATYVGGGWFLLANLDQEFIYVDTAGFAKPAEPQGVGTVMGGYIKGMAFPVQLCQAPEAGFTWTSTLYDATFTDTSVTDNTISSWLWDFGDGNTSTSQNPTHTYAATGTYTVCLTVTDTCNTDSVCQTVTITCPDPIAGFTATSNLYTATFTDTSIGNSISSWQWDFGDGNTSNSQNPTHNYAAAGTYIVCLIVNDVCFDDTICQPVTITCPGPIPGFSVTSNLYTADFTDTTTGNFVSSWLWDFGDGNTSTMQNPSHNYAAAGAYTVCLTVTDTCGTDSVCQTVVITCPGPTAGFSHVETGLTTALTDTSMGNFISSWLWDFGDGNTSTMQNPSHNYATPGTYTVCLTVTDTCGTDSVCQSVTVTCTPPSAGFTWTTTLLNASFTDTSTTSSAFTGWMWDFGDGNTSTDQNPTHTYATEGTYYVCLTATDSCTSAMFCDSVTIVCPPPVAAFNSQVNGLNATFTDNSSSATGTLYSWMWDFGDGNTSTMMSPSHSYATTGTYNVCLTVMDSCGSTTICQNVEICTSNGVNLGPDIIICDVDTLILDAGAADSYLWSDNSTGQTLMVDGSQLGVGTYTYWVLRTTGSCEEFDDIGVVVQVCPGINELGDDFDVSYYPNPTSGQLTVQFEGRLSNIKSYDIVNVRGELVYSKQLNLNAAQYQEQIDLTDVANGLYFLRVTSENSMYVNKVVITK